MAITVTSVATNAVINTAPIYDPRYMEFTEWASLMCEQYAGQQLEIPDERTDWKGWAVGLKGIDLFNNEAIPDPYVYANWSDWAEALVLSINLRPQQ